MMAWDTIQIDHELFNFFRKFLKKYSGYELQEDKAYLLHSRTRKLLSDRGLEDMTHLADALSQPANQSLQQAFIEAMTINETLFFRDEKIFRNFIDVLLPQFIEMGKKHINIWSAACSSGQEAYSLAMAIEANRSRFPFLDYRILATDINQQVLDRAAEGCYSDFEIKRGLSASYIERFFTMRENGQVQINPKIREKIRFRRRNLQDPFTGIGPFDIILLRNVLIYFDNNLKEQILTRCWSVLADGGALALGGAENIAQLRHPFPRFTDESGFYRKTAN